MSKGYHSKYPSPVNPEENFFQSDFSTEAEQDNAIIAAIQGGGTGINPHQYTGGQQGKFYDDIVSPLSLGLPLYESNGGSYIKNRGGSPVFEYPPDAILECLPIYNKTKHINYLLEAYRDFLWSSEYFFYCISLPYNTENSLVTWKQTYRDQIDIPPKSYLLAVQAKAYKWDEEVDRYITPTTFRLQIYDDGAGEYLYNTTVNTSIVAGNDTPRALNGNSFGPFILPSPLSIVPNGMLTVAMTNIEATGTLVHTTDGAIQAYVGLIFAVPKNCNFGEKNATPDNRSI